MGENKDVPFKWLLAVSGGAALLVALWFYPKVFPISGLRIQVSRSEAAERATRFVQQQGVRIPPGYTRATRFIINDGAKTYLEQKLGIARANQVAQTQGFVYGWYTRWFRPGSERIIAVTIDPEGRVLSFVDRLPSDAPAPPSRQPRRTAERFVTQVLGIDLRAYRSLGEYQASRPNRVDYSYLWERNDLQLGEAKERIRVAVTGDRVIYFLRHLHYPESFTHTLRWHRSRGNLIALTANAITVVFGIVLLAVLLFGAARRDLHWRLGWTPAVLVAGVYLLNYLNEIPLRIATMEPDQTWGAFWVGTVAVTLLGSLVAGLQILLIIAAAEWVYRKAFPQAIPLQHWFTRRGWAHPEGRKRVVLGYWLLAIHLLYIVAFLAVARRLLGAWAPATVPYDDLMSTAAPWAYPMLTAIEASVQEEFLFRVFLISLFARYLRSVWMGILVSAVVWSALHCSYPTVPYYLRAVELIPIGILWGWFVASFGPIPSMIAHALYNAAISSDIFLYSAGFLPKLSFAVVVLFILLPAALVWRWSRHPA
ncbi:MAG: CPBP family intramembrane metalloprotease, partial [Armatimonadetes bacterium]|nr:CPBP family intramembrane metalloprotease [Armatimonadota bacterium]